LSHHYASKAFPCLAIARIAAQEGLWLDAASAGELLTALRADFPPNASCFTATTNRAKNSKWQ
jgi:diaminopimelate decarboxylase